MEASVASNELVLLEQTLQPLAPRFADVLGSVMKPERLIRTLMISCERNPQLLTCDRQSLLNGAMTFAVLGLEVDGITGQGFLVPFKDRKLGKTIAQPIIGYLGYNTLAARSGMTITGRVVRDGDEFDYDEGQGFVRHKRLLGHEDSRPIIAVWAKAAALGRPPAVRVLSIDEINAVKARSPRGDEPPWADHKIGFPAMAEKTAKRRLRRDMPLNVFQLAATMEQAFEEQGKPSYIRDDRAVVIDGEAFAPTIRQDQRSTTELLSPASSAVKSAAPAVPPERQPQVGAADNKSATDWDGELEAAAKKGTEALKEVWATIPPGETKKMLEQALRRRHQPEAVKADAGAPA
jgi:recombination protein RecT